MKKEHNCFDHYYRLHKLTLICDVCGKITTTENKKNPVKDFIENIDDGINLDKGD